MLQKSDKVVMHTCGEANFYEGIVWTCRSNQFKQSSGAQSVMLEGSSGSFATKYLKKINMENETSVICNDCEKTILHESKGWYFEALTGKYHCNQCHREREEKLQNEKYVLNAMNEIQMTHTVLKNAHVEKLHLENKRDLAYVEACISDIRVQEGKHPFPEYIVINRDENPQMLREIIEVMKRHNKWG